MSRPVITVAPDAPVKAAARLLADHSISALPVVAADGRLVGIVSEADLLPLETRPDPRSQARPLPASAGTTPRTVGDVMTRTVITVEAGSDVSHAARLMLESDVKRLPVMERGELAGIVSRHDLVRVIARPDGEVQAEVDRRLHDAGIELACEALSVQNGLAAIRLADRDADRRLAESVALTVAGVLEVRFTG